MNGRIVIISVLLILVLATLSFALEEEEPSIEIPEGPVEVVDIFEADYGDDSGECIVCDLIIDRPQSNMRVMRSDESYIRGVSLYYENFSRSPPRTAIENTMLFVYVIPAEGYNELLKMYTNEDGEAFFDFSEYAAIAEEEQITYTFTIIYCPFCHPDDPGYPCGFDECIAYTGIEIPPEITGPDPVSLVPLAEGSIELTAEEVSAEHFLPSTMMITYSPPPPPAGLTPGFCLPLVIIFALVGGALYYTGRNPFGAFSLGSPRIGRHIKYTPSGRSVSISGKYIIQSVKAGVGEAKDMKAKKAAKAKMSAADLKKEKEAKREAAKEVGLQLVTLGGYGMVAGSKGRIATAGPMKGMEVGGGKGLIQRIKEAPGVAKGAKGKFMGKTMFVTPAGRRTLGLKGGRKGVIKGWAKGFGEAITLAGGAMIKSSFLSVLGFGKLADRMINFTIDKDRSAIAAQYVQRLMIEEDTQKLINKLDRMVEVGTAKEITAEGKTFYEIESKGKEGTITTMTYNKEMLHKGELGGTQIITGTTASGQKYTETRYFASIAGTTATELTKVTIQTEVKGKTETGIVAAEYVIGTTPVSGAAGLEAIAAPVEMNQLQLQKLEVKTADGTKLAPGTEAYKNATDFAGEFRGKPIDIKEVHHSFINTNVDKKTTMGGMARDLQELKTQHNETFTNMAAIHRASEINALYKQDKKLKKSVDKYEKKITDVIKKTDPAAMEVLLTVSQATGEKNIAEHFEGKANKQIANAGRATVAGDIAQTEIKPGTTTEDYRRQNDAKIDGANALYSLGTELTWKNKKDVMMEIKTQMNKVYGPDPTPQQLKKLSPEQQKTAVQLQEQKKMALDTAKSLYGNAKSTATEWNKTIGKATDAYKKMQKIKMDLPIKGKVSKEVNNAALYGALIGGKDGIVQKVMSTSAGKEIADTPEKKYLRTVITEGRYKAPEAPKPPELPAYGGVTTIPTEKEKWDEWYGRLKTEERIIVDIDNEIYTKEAKQYEKEKKKYEKKNAEWEKKKQDLQYGGGFSTASTSSLIIDSAIKKGVKLPKSVYNNAASAIKSGDPKKWEEAAKEAAKAIEKEEKKMEKKMTKELSEFEM